MKTREYRRKKKIIKPKLQWRMMIVFAILAVSSVAIQSIALGTTLILIADQLPNDSEILYGKIPALVWITLAGTAFLVLPLHVLVGRTLTFKVAGPLYRFEVYLRQIAAGERPGPCWIRKDDELQDLCEVLNEAVAPLSTPLPEVAKNAEQPTEEPAAPISSTQEETTPTRS